MELYHPVKIGRLELSGNVFLAPVAGWTDRAFRSICIESGADFTFTELVSSEALVRDNAKCAPLIRRAENETRYAVQLFGANSDCLYQAASMLAPYKPGTIDLNAGCPVPKVTKTGAGSALMRNVPLLGKIIAALVKASNDYLDGIPVTVKMRCGWDFGNINYVECARAAVESGASMITLHPRTKTQGYEGKSNWDYIGDLVTRINVPVSGSGDLYTPMDAKKMLAETACAAVMFARGAMGNPFIFAQTRAYLQNLPPESQSETERINTAFKHLQLLTEDFGEHSACRQMRKIFCSYTKGMDGAAALRNRLVHAETINDYHSIIDNCV